MGEKDFENITPESLINGPLSRESEPVQGAGMPKERFLKAIREIAHLEKILEEKNSALASAAEEKDRLIHALDKSFEDKKRLQDRIADIDIVRNMEIVEFKAGLDKLRDDNNVLRKQKDELLDDIYKKDKDIEDLKYTIERKELEITEAKAYLDTALDTLRKSELKCKELESNLETEEQKKTGFAESPLILNSMPHPIEMETVTAYAPEVEELSNTISALKAEIDEKNAENIALRNEVTQIQADVDKEKENAAEFQEKEDISLKLELAAENTKHNEFEKAIKELSADKRLLYVKSPADMESAPQIPEKMVYVAPAEDIKKKLLKIAAVFIIGGGLFAAYKFLLN